MRKKKKKKSPPSFFSEAIPPVRLRSSLSGSSTSAQRHKGQVRAAEMLGSACNRSALLAWIKPPLGARRRSRNGTGGRTSRSSPPFQIAARRTPCCLFWETDRCSYLELWPGSMLLPACSNAQFGKTTAPYWIFTNGCMDLAQMIISCFNFQNWCWGEGGWNEEGSDAKDGPTHRSAPLLRRNKVYSG